MKFDRGISSRPFDFRHVSICGYSGSGKTTLVEKLLPLLAAGRRVGYLKHDAHRFELDHAGKDSWRAWAAGAHAAWINDGEHSGGQVRDPAQGAERGLWSECGLILVEGYKRSPLPKLVLVDAEGRIEEALAAGELEPVAALAVADEATRARLAAAWPQTPVFLRDDTAAIAEFILELVHGRRPKMRGLVLWGGESTRMGHDKGRIDYHGRPHGEWLFDLLARAGIDSAVSCRSDQAERVPAGLPQVHDVFNKGGPLAGILSAFHQDPEAAWLVVAVDLPHVDEAALAHLLSERRPERHATCYLNPEKGWAEPLFTIWEPSAAPVLLRRWFFDDVRCPRRLLGEMDYHGLAPLAAHHLDNANTPEDLERARRQLAEGF